MKTGDDVMTGRAGRQTNAGA